MRTRRVGSITCGVVLIVFGILFILHMLVPAMTYTFIFHLWPLILIFLGLEMLIANVRTAKTEEVAFKYDAGAIVLVVILSIFSMGMGMVEFMMENYEHVYYSVF